MRPRPRPDGIDVDELAELYVDRRMSPLERFAIPVRPRPRSGGIDVDELAELSQIRSEGYGLAAP